MPEQKHIIWSNIDLDLDDWYDDLHEEYPALGEEGLRDMMYQYNFEYFSDAQSQLDMYVGSPISEDCFLLRVGNAVDNIKKRCFLRLGSVTIAPIANLLFVNDQCISVLYLK